MLNLAGSGSEVGQVSARSLLKPGVARVPCNRTIIVGFEEGASWRATFLAKRVVPPFQCSNVTHVRTNT